MGEDSFSLTVGDLSLNDTPFSEEAHSRCQQRAARC